MMGLGTTELLIILGIVILLFGGKKLPQLGRSLGSAITNFKRGLNEKPEDKIEEDKNSHDK